MFLRPRFDLRDRVVLVTGGARGIGFEVARKAAQRGAVPALIDVDGAAAKEAAFTLGGGAIAAQTVYPSRWRAGYLLRGVLGPLGDAAAVRDRRLRALMADVRARDLGSV